MSCLNQNLDLVVVQCDFQLESLDKQLAKSADKSVEEALLLVSKEAALKEVEAQLTTAQDRAKRAEQEANKWVLLAFLRLLEPIIDSECQVYRVFSCVVGFCCR